MLLLLLLTGLGVSGADAPSASHSYAEGRHGVVVSGSTDAAAAGLEMLRVGGNAADAADRDAYYGDPLHADIPLEHLLSQEYARGRRALIDMQKASCELQPGRVPGMGDSEAEPHTRPPDRVRDTTTCLTADRWGNVVAATPSGWGGVLAGDTGIWLGSRLISFNTRPGHPNCIQPGKRPRITLTPTIVLKDGRPVLAVSVAGGDAQDQASLQIVTNFIDFALSAVNWSPRRGMRRNTTSALSISGRPSSAGSLSTDASALKYCSPCKAAATR